MSNVPATVNDISREDVVLKRIFEDPVIQNRIISHLSSDLFEDTLNRGVCKIILQYYNKYSKFPNMQELTVSMPHCAERNKIIALGNFKLESIDSDLATDLVEGFFKEAKTKKVLTDAAEAIHERDFTNIAELIKELQESVNFSVNTDVGLDVVDDAEEALRRLNESMKAIPSGIDGVNSFTARLDADGKPTGGHYRKALSIFLGMPNVGKSIVLCNEAAYAYQRGYNVLYVTLELAEELIWERIASNITDISMQHMRISSAENVKELLIKNKINTSACGEIFVKSMPTTTTVVEIENVLQEISRDKGVDIDMLVVDYIGIMKPSKRINSIQNHSLYTMGKEVAEQLRDLAKRYGIAAVTASQLNRDGYDSTDSSMKNTAGSAGLNDTADLMITITQDNDLKQANMFFHMILKNRFGPNSIIFLSNCDYDHMRVRSASNQQVHDYNQRRANVGTEVEGFNDNDSLDMNESGGAKDPEAIKKQKAQKESKKHGKKQPALKKEIKTTQNKESEAILDKKEPIEPTTNNSKSIASSADVSVGVDEIY